MDRGELERRTLEFSVKLVKTLKSLPKNLINYKLSGQVIDSGTSIGANYREANGAESKKDFKHKISLSFKESRETKYWLSILKAANPEHNSDLQMLWSEADEFARIFGTIVSSCNKNPDNQQSQI